MSTAKTVFKNTLVLAASQVLSILLGFLTLSYTANKLGVGDFGVLNLALSITAIYVVFNDFGASTYLTREVARARATGKKYLGNILAFKIALTFVFTLVLLVAVNLVGYSEKTLAVVYLIILAQVFYGFTQVFNAVFQAYERMEYQSVGAVLNTVLMLAGVLVAIRYDMDVTGFALVYVATYFVVMAYSLAVCAWKFVLPRLEFDGGFIRSTVGDMAPFGITAILGSIYYYFGTVILQSVQGDNAVGLFNAAYRLFLMIIIVPQVFTMALFPVMSRFFVTSEGSLRLAQEKYLKYMAILAVPMGVGATLLAGNIIRLIYDPTFDASAVALQILIWSAACIFISCTFGSLINSSNRQSIAMKIAALCAVENLVVNALLILRFSYIGASVASLVTEFTSLAVYIFISSRIGYGPSRRSLFGLAKIILASGVMGAFILVFASVNVIVLIIAAAALYFVALYVLGGIDKSDLDLLKSARGRDGERAADEKSPD